MIENIGDSKIKFNVNVLLQEISLFKEWINNVSCNDQKYLYLRMKKSMKKTQNTQERASSQNLCLEKVSHLANQDQFSSQTLANT